MVNLNNLMWSAFDYVNGIILVQDADFMLMMTDITSLNYARDQDFEKYLTNSMIDYGCIVLSRQLQVPGHHIVDVYSTTLLQRVLFDASDVYMQYKRNKRMGIFKPQATDACISQCWCTLITRSKRLEITGFYLWQI